MAKKKIEKQETKPQAKANFENAGIIVDQPIVDVLEKNYMPYAMSVIVSRAIPEIDGFKPSHRKLLYTMYKMGLLSGGKTKSANIVGQTMKLNPHGDQAIYDTMVRMSRGHAALLHPWIDSKGNLVRHIPETWSAPLPVIPKRNLTKFPRNFSATSIKTPLTLWITMTTQ